MFVDIVSSIIAFSIAMYLIHCFSVGYIEQVIKNQKLNEPKPTEEVNTKPAPVKPAPVKPAPKPAVVHTKPKPVKIIKKPEIDKTKLNEYADILNAIGFSSKDAKTTVKKLLTQNPNLTQEELLRKATQK